MNFIERIQYFMTQEGINDNQFTVAAGLSNGSIGKAKKSGKAMRSDNIEKILLAYPDLNPEWLLTGKGPMRKTKRIDTFRTPLDTPSGDIHVVKDNENSSEIQIINADTTTIPSGIPLIPFEAMAGFLTGEMSVNKADCEQIYIPNLRADFVIPISGDSMSPAFISGDLVACQFVNLRDSFFQWGKVYIIDTNQGVILKHVRRGSTPDTLRLISQNPDYDPFEIPLSSVYHIALVKCVIRSL